MKGVHMLAAAGLGLSAVAMLVHFLFNPFYEDAIDTGLVWDVLDVVMAVGILVALAYTFVHKRTLAADASTVAHVCAYTVFYVTAALAILFYWNWFDDLVSGGDQSDTRFIYWPLINTLYILVAGTVGLHQWRRGAGG